MWNIQWDNEECHQSQPYRSIAWPSMLAEQCVPEKFSQLAHSGYLGMKAGRPGDPETREGLELFLSMSSRDQRLDVATYEIYREDKQVGASSLSLLTVTKDNRAPIHEKQALVAEGKIQNVLGMAALNVTGQVNPNTMQLPAFCKQHAAPSQG